jgi:hypothetical protein
VHAECAGSTPVSQPPLHVRCYASGRSGLMLNQVIAGSNPARPVTTSGSVAKLVECTRLLSEGTQVRILPDPSPTQRGSSSVGRARVSQTRDASSILVSRFRQQGRLSGTAGHALVARRSSSGLLIRGRGFDSLQAHRRGRAHSVHRLHFFLRVWCNASIRVLGTRGESSILSTRTKSFNAWVASVVSGTPALQAGGLSASLRRSTNTACGPVAQLNESACLRSRRAQV